MRAFPQHGAALQLHAIIGPNKFNYLLDPFPECIDYETRFSQYTDRHRKEKPLKNTGHDLKKRAGTQAAAQ